MSWLSVCLLACQFIWTSQNALGSCDCLLRSFGTDNPLVYTLACVKTSPNALGSCCYSARSSKKVTIKRIMASNTKDKIDMDYPLGKRGVMKSKIHVPVSHDALCASSKIDIHSVLIRISIKTRLCCDNKDQVSVYVSTATLDVLQLKTTTRGILFPVDIRFYIVLFYLRAFITISY